jgi:hypothetical protein
MAMMNLLRAVHTTPIITPKIKESAVIPDGTRVAASPAEAAAMPLSLPAHDERAIAVSESQKVSSEKEKPTTKTANPPSPPTATVSSASVAKPVAEKQILGETPNEQLPASSSRFMSTTPSCSESVPQFVSDGSVESLYGGQQPQSFTPQSSNDVFISPSVVQENRALRIEMAEMRKNQAEIMSMLKRMSGADKMLPDGPDPAHTQSVKVLSTLH